MSYLWFHLLNNIGMINHFVLQSLKHSFEQCESISCETEKTEKKHFNPIVEYICERRCCLDLDRCMCFP